MYGGYYEYSWEDTYEITGSISKKKDTISLTVDEIYNHWETTDNGYTTRNEQTTTLDCEVIIDTKDKMPKPIDDFKTISDITEKDIEAWIEKLEYIF